MTLVGVSARGGPRLVVKEGALSQVPENNRATLVAKLKAAAEATSDRHLDVLFELLPPQCRGGIQDKEEWKRGLRFETSDRLLRFVVLAVYRGGWSNAEYKTPADEDWWVVTGCAKYRTDSGIRQYQSKF